MIGTASQTNYYRRFCKQVQHVPADLALTNVFTKDGGHDLKHKKASENKGFSEVTGGPKTEEELWQKKL